MTTEAMHPFTIAAVFVVLALSVECSMHIPTVNLKGKAKAFGKNVARKGIPALVGGAAIGGVMGAVDALTGGKDESSIKITNEVPSATEQFTQTTTVVGTAGGMVVTGVLILLLRYVWLKLVLYKNRMARSRQRRHSLTSSSSPVRGRNRRTRSLSSSTTGTASV